MISRKFQMYDFQMYDLQTYAFQMYDCQSDDLQMFDFHAHLVAILFQSKSINKWTFAVCTIEVLMYRDNQHLDAVQKYA
jgi:hypothetical protein